MVSIMDSPELYQNQVNEWIDRVSKNPKDAEAMKNLSIFFIQNRQNAKANLYIYRALELLPGDYAVLFYKGLHYEEFDMFDDALKIYKRYSEIPSESPYRDLMEGRYFRLMRNKAYSDIGLLIKNESEISFDSVSENTVAVFPLIYQGMNKDYVPLSRGFSEMFSIDLAKVKRLTILERVRIQALLDEIKLSQSSLVDQSTAPRAGKLLKAGVIISGDFDITRDDNLKLNLGSWNSKTSERKSWVSKRGNLNDLFILQKEILFDFLQKNNIELTQAEKEAIAHIPTQNLESFLEYSKGLLREDAGDYKGAESFFQRSVELDPQFNSAGEKLQSSQAVSNSGGDKDQLISVLRINDPIVKNEAIRIVEDRTQNLSERITSNFIQGIDSRSPAQEGSVNSELPMPPPPPGK